MRWSSWVVVQSKMWSDVVDLDAIVALAAQPDVVVPKEILEAIRYRHPIHDWLRRSVFKDAAPFLRGLGLASDDRNADFRARVLATLMLGDLPKNRALLEALLDAETEWSEHGIGGHVPSIDIACYLHALAQPVVSAMRIWRAKLSSFDNQAMIDGHYCVATGDIDATLELLARTPHASEAHAYLSEMRARGELDDLGAWRATTATRLREIAAELLE